MFRTEEAQRVLLALEPNKGSPTAHGLAMAAERLGTCDTCLIDGTEFVRLEDVLHVLGRAVQIPDEAVTAAVVASKLRAIDPPPDLG